MADGSGFDPCECIYGHESAMQRLLSMLRQSQSYCSDVGCPTELPGPATDPTGSSSAVSMGMIFCVWIVIMAVMFFMGMGPRRRTTPEGKDFSDMPPNNDRGPPPAVL